MFSGFEFGVEISYGLTYVGDFRGEFGFKLKLPEAGSTNSGSATKECSSKASGAGRAGGERPAIGHKEAATGPLATNDRQMPAGGCRRPTNGRARPNTNPPLPLWSLVGSGIDV